MSERRPSEPICFEKTRTSNPQGWHLLLLLAIIAFTYRFVPGSDRPTEARILDWRQATIEGFSAGVTKEQIESVRGPARANGNDRWEWNSPDLYLERERDQIRLIGHQVECQQRIMPCGNRFGARDSMEALKRAGGRGLMPFRWRSSPSLQQDIQACFGQGQVCSMECSPLLEYVDSVGVKTLSFRLSDRTAILGSSGQVVTRVAWTWPVKPSVHKQPILPNGTIYRSTANTHLDPARLSVQK